ncbi:porin [Rhodoferax ferrireducens]|uniref:porin n=1 Tax=Rhodoferax ferrireducens TaxID=192843 RepID=UPI000E0D7090|nr:porin [Rhodoferax ferrireducens]
MKKTLIALAVLAASGAAMAQSTVTLYGVADTWFGQTETGVGAAKLKQTVLNTNGMNSSRWGLKGSEDLGGGLKAVFQLESGFNIDTGAQTDSASLFNRQAFVGLAGGFGSVTAGRQYTAYDALRGATNNTYDTAAFTTTGTVWGYGAVADYASRVNNSIAYTSPDFGGFSGAAVVGLGENKTATVDANQNLSLHVKYAKGPVLVGYAYQEQKAQNALVTDTATTKYNLIAGSYDFGVVKLVGGYNTAKVNDNSDKEYQLGLSAPIGTSANVAIGYTKSKGEVAGATTSNGKGYSVVGYYDLSKRTRLYAAASKTTADNNAGADTAATANFGLGVRHNF